MTKWKPTQKYILAFVSAENLVPSFLGSLKKSFKTQAVLQNYTPVCTAE